MSHSQTVPQLDTEFGQQVDVRNGFQCRKCIH